MKRLPLEEYLENMPGHWTSGEGWIHFCTPEPYLTGGIAWGAFGAASADPLLRCATVSLLKLPEHQALVDGRRVRAIDAASFKMGGEYFVRNRKRFGNVQQMAGIRPIGIAGAITEGFFRLVPPPYLLRIFGERGEALRWLGSEQHSAMIDDIEGRAATTSTSVDFVSDLHRVINDNIVDATVADASKRLGVSVRSLQRRLRAEGTSFQREIAVVRVRAAQRLMRETDAPLSRIATDVGFASPATFSVVFRRHEGMSPREWRDAQPALR